MRLRFIFVALLVALPFARANAQANVTFGVLGLFHPSELDLRPAGAQVLTASSESETFILNGETGHQRLLLQADGDHLVVSGRTMACLHVSARDGARARFQLAVPGKIHRVYAGLLTITAQHGELIAVVTMEREDAVAAIVASEMPHTAPLEALKAQAVVTRSFLASGRRHRDFDFCDTTHCQFLRSPDDITKNVRRAVEDTQGLVLTWSQHPIAAMYSSRCGGHTGTMRQIGMDPGNAYPYYSVQCRWCHEHPIHWRTAMEPGVPKSDAASESARIQYARQWGWGALPGNRFSVSHDSAGDWIEGRNVGHGLGLCQFGAIGMAASGQGFRAILMHYYPNSTLERLP
jgi:hypothetical protein